jgi:SpoVK/Ycf46/Vps4 family AAA+-type ATPase
MDELITYLRKSFDEPTLKIVNFMEKSNLLISEMKIDQVKDGDKIVNRPSPNIIETSYLRLCDEDPEFKHDMMGEVFLHYLEYVLRDVRANWRLDINRLKQDLETKCGYCNIQLKNCPMKVLAYIKKCAKDEKINEIALFDNLMGKKARIPVNDIEENNIAEKIVYLCNSPIDLKGAEFLLDTDSITIESDDYGKITYRTIDFEVNNISLINNLYDYFVNGRGINGKFDIANLKLSDNFSYMFEKSPVELAVCIKYFCDSKNVNYTNVFEKIYAKLGRFESIPKLAYYNEYVKKIDSSLENSLPLKQELKDVLTYIRNYDNKLKLPYIKFDFLIYTQNSQLVDNIVSILNKYCRTYNYLSNKNVMYIDTEMFIMRAKDCYDVVLQLDKLYVEYDFLVFGNLDKAENINEYRLDTFLSMIPKFYNRNKRSITIFTGEKKVVEKIIEKYDSLQKIFIHKIDVEALDVKEVKNKIYNKLNKVVNLTNSAKTEIDNYIEKSYQKGIQNESKFINDVYEYVVYNKYKENVKDDDIKLENLGFSKDSIKVDDVLKKINNLVGLAEVKQRVNEIIKYLEFQRKIGETENINCNMLFRGNAGTGKTTMTKLMAELFSGLGIIKSNKVIEVIGKDLIGIHLGETAPKTQRIIDSALDGVLVIDEAHTIATSKGNADYPAEAIATICDSMDRYKNRLIIIFAGNSKEMSNFLSKYPGLSSRIGFSIEFEDFTVENLMNIFENKLKERKYDIEDLAKAHIKKNIEKAKISRNFGNARYIDTIFEKLILTHATHCLDDKNLKLITVQDVENMEKAEISKDITIDDILKDLNSLIGLKNIKEMIEGFVSVLEFNKKLNRKTDFNMHMIFKGNAGTGKTTVARLIANIYYSLGYIRKNKVVEVQSQDLIAEWLGQTGPKTQAVIDSALDGVLFIDEAYSLMEHRGSTASYTAEAIATLLKAMEDYKGRLIVIFAGYTEEMMQFRDLNPGLKSRIGFELTFNDYDVDELVQIFEKKIKDQELEIDKKAISKARKILEEAKKVENFGNGRFVDNMVQRVIIEHAKRMKNEENPEILRLITAEDISDEIKAERSKNKIGF